MILVQQALMFLSVNVKLTILIIRMEFCTTPRAYNYFLFYATYGALLALQLQFVKAATCAEKDCAQTLPLKFDLT
jgi:hypothetical protein